MAYFPLHLRIVLPLLLLSPGANSGQELKPPGAPAPKFVAFQLKYSSAERVVEKLKSRLGADALVAFDQESNTAYVRADAANLQRATLLVERFDTPQRTHLIQLENANPFVVATLVAAAARVRSLLTDEPDLAVTPLPRTPMIIFTGTASQAQWVFWLVKQLDAQR